MEWIVQLPILFFSIIIHEISHGFMAYSRGDDTAEMAGRLTLNPIPHIDPFGSLFLPFMCKLSGLPMFGWAKPVPVNAARLRSPRRDMIWVAAMGPLSNIALAFGAAVLFKLTVISPIAPSFKATMLDALIFGASVNLYLAFFNLIPVHPLDGSQVVRGMLPPAMSNAYMRHVPYGFYIIVALIATRAAYTFTMIPASIVLGLFERMGLLSYYVR